MIVSSTNHISKPPCQSTDFMADRYPQNHWLHSSKPSLPLFYSNKLDEPSKPPSHHFIPSLFLHWIISKKVLKVLHDSRKPKNPWNLGTKVCLFHKLYNDSSTGSRGIARQCTSRIHTSWTTTSHSVQLQIYWQFPTIIIPTITIPTGPSWYQLVNSQICLMW